MVIKGKSTLEQLALWNRFWQSVHEAYEVFRVRFYESAIRDIMQMLLSKDCGEKGLLKRATMDQLTVGCIRVWHYKFGCIF